MMEIGDKFIIEIAEILKQPQFPGDPVEPPALYRIKGFGTLVFDEYGLSKLKKYSENEKKDLIQIGDEVTGDGYTFFVTRISPDNIFADGIDRFGKSCTGRISWLKRTGRRNGGLVSALLSLDKC